MISPRQSKVGTLRLRCPRPRSSGRNGLMPKAQVMPIDATRTAQSHHPFLRAFTLIEMMVVIAIIATILMAALPSLYGFVHKEGFRKTVSDVVDTCRSARAEAIMHDTTAELVFHPRDGTVEASAGGSGHGVWAHTARFENCTIEMLDIDLREYKDEPVATVTFYPNGRCNEMTLVLRSDKGEYRKISIECTTGVPLVSSKLDF